MFYSQFILAKKGPLGTIWIAAHLERKLRKNQVADTDIGTSVDSILFPEVPIALRLSSHLLLGVVKIYSKKVNYLFDDCSEALLKIKQAFRSAAVDLPPEESTAPYHSITLPETFDLDDFELPDNELFESNYVDHHVSTREQITLQDTLVGVAYATSQYGLDDRFGDGDVSQMGLDIDEDLFGDKVLSVGVDGVATDLEAEAQATVQPMTPLKNDEINVGTTEVSDALTDDCNRFQMQCTPMIMDLNEVADTPFTTELMNDGTLSDINGIFGCDDVPNFENNSSPESPFPTNNANSSSTDFQDDISNSNPPHIVGVSIEENNMPLFKTANNPHGDFNISADSNMPFLCEQEISNVDDTISKSSLYCSDQVKTTALPSENINSDGCFHGVQIDMNNDLALNKARGRYIPDDNGIAGVSSITQEASMKQYSIFEAISGKSGSESNSCPFSEGILSKYHVSSTDVCVAATHGCVELGNNHTQTSKEPGSLLDVKSCSSYVSTSNSMNMNDIGPASLPFPRISTASDTNLIDEVSASFLCPSDGPLQKVQPPFVTEISSMTDTAKGLAKSCEFVSSLTSDSACTRTPNHIRFPSGNSAHDRPRLEDYDNKMEHLGIGNHELNQPFVNLSTCGDVCPSKDVSNRTFPYYESRGNVEVLKNGPGVCMDAMTNEISNPFTYGRVSNNHVHILQPPSSQQHTSFHEGKNSFNISAVMPATVRQCTYVEYGEESPARFSEKNSSCLSVASRDCGVVKKHIDNEILIESYAENTDRCTEFDLSEKFLSVPAGIQKFPFLVGDAINGANLEGDTNVSTNAALNSGKIPDVAERFQTPQTPVFTAVSRSIIMDRENMLDFSAPALTIPDTGYLTVNSNDFDSVIVNSGEKHDPQKTTSKRARHSDVFFGLHNSSRTVELMDDDDDLLSSILVGKGSLSGLKLKPSPPYEVAPCKRIRLTPRASSSKRKVIVDDAIILHGDTMRHQLTSTEDIRRSRKKAPYTRSEILLTRIQFMEDGIFDEPTHTGMLSELYNLNNSNIINVTVIDANTPPVECMVINSDIGADNFARSMKKSAENNNPMQTCLFDRNDVKNSSTEELIDSCMQSYNSIYGAKYSESDQRNPLKHTFESLYSSGKPDDILKAIKVSRSEGNNQISQSMKITNSHMKSDACSSGMKASVSDESKLCGRSLKSTFVFPSEDDVDCTRRRWDEDDVCVEVQPMLMVQHTQFQCGDVNTGIKVSTEAHDSSPRGEDEEAQVSPKYLQHGIEIDGGIRNVELTCALIDGKNLCESDMIRPSTSFEKVDGDSLAPSVISSVQPGSDDSVMDLNGNEDPLGDFKCTEEPSLNPPKEQNDYVSTPVCEDLDNEGGCVRDMACETRQLDGINSLSVDREEGIFQDINSSFINNVNDIFPIASHVVEAETQKESGSIENGENSKCQVATTNDVNLASITMSPTVAESDAGMENLIFEQDTDFLKLDYECYIEGSEAIPFTEEVVNFENSGWSSRTRAVAKYLQAWFCNEDGQGTVSLPLDGILNGKTRKEASRMFFETLVLKSRDYVEVEQEKAYGRIEIKGGGKLLKDDKRV